MSDKKTTGIWKVISASSMGTMIEWYDFYIFGSLAVVISTKFLQTFKILTFILLELTLTFFPFLNENRDKILLKEKNIKIQYSKTKKVSLGEIKIKKVKNKNKIKHEIFS